MMNPPSVSRSLLHIAGVVALLATLPAHAFDLEGHRGTRGLMPENTLAAFNRAIEIGVTTLETDLAVTKDGVLVISHDPDLIERCSRRIRLLDGRVAEDTAASALAAA